MIINRNLLAVIIATVLGGIVTTSATADSYQMRCLRVDAGRHILYLTELFPVSEWIGLQENDEMSTYYAQWVLQNDPQFDLSNRRAGAVHHPTCLVLTDDIELNMFMINSAKRKGFAIFRDAFLPTPQQIRYLDSLRNRD